jgi:signal transduction histidine kinase
MPHILTLEPIFEDVARRMRGRHFTTLADALRSCIDAILKRWRKQSLKAMPGLDQLTIEQFEDSMASILRAIADAMETDDAEQLRRVIEEAPSHGIERIAQEFPIDAILAEAGILRSSIIAELHEHMQHTLSEEEAAALHELIDLAFERSTLEFIRIRNQHRENEMARQVAGMRRLADLGTLVAGVAHDASNLLLPARMGLARIRQCRIDDDARTHIQTLEQVFQHFQNTIVNLRWLTVDPANQPRDREPLDLKEFARDYQQFLSTMLPGAVSLEIDIRDDVPPVRISAAALSQILFNLIRNAQEAIMKHQQQGRILLWAEPNGDAEVNLAVEDDGPGMTPDVCERCFDPFFTTKEKHGKSGGLGLTVVHALVVNSGGSIEVRSPTPRRTGMDHNANRGTAFILCLPAETRDPAVKTA